MNVKGLGLGVLCFLALGWGGCGTDGSKGSRGVTVNPCRLDELYVGDMVTITFGDLPNTGTGGGIPEQKVPVKEDGTLSLPMNMSVLAAGKIIGDLEKEIVKLYVPTQYNRLSVTLKTESRFYFVGGEVKQPGRQLYMGPTTVIRAIQSCGDFTDFARRTKVKIQRANGQVEIVNCKKAITTPKLDVPICPGDAIHVPRRIM